MKLLQPESGVEEIPVLSTAINFKVPASFGEVRLKSFEKILAKVQQRELGKQDFMVPMSDIKFSGLNILEVATHGRFFLSELAFYQLCALLRVPFDYMQRCPLDLRNENLIYWMDQYEERKVLLRTRILENEEDEEGGVLRAILPKTYEPIDNVRILEWVAGALNHFNGTLGIHYAKVQEASTHIRLLFDKPVDLHDTDRHYFGIHVGDSEVGERGFTSSFADYRAQSDSGCIHKVDGKHLVNQRHIHVDFKLLRRAFDEGFDIASEYRDTIVDLLQSARQAAVRDAPTYIRRLVRHYRLTNEFAEAVITAYESEPNPTKYGIAQALTRAAKRMPIDAQIDTEQLAGAFILEAA